jgi:hypothetical protein
VGEDDICIDLDRSRLGGAKEEEEYARDNYKGSSNVALNHAPRTKVEFVDSSVCIACGN